MGSKRSSYSMKINMSADDIRIVFGLYSSNAYKKRIMLILI